jgi:hypothetical protein
MKRNLTHIVLGTTKNAVLASTSLNRSRWIWVRKCNLHAKGDVHVSNSGTSPVRYGDPHHGRIGSKHGHDVLYTSGSFIGLSCWRLMVMKIASKLGFKDLNR